jgi:hypothetical protein
MNELKQNEKDAKIAIVAANNHYGGYGPRTEDIFRENIDTQKLSFDNVVIGYCKNKSTIRIRE